MSNAGASAAEIDAVITPEVRAWIGRTTDLLPLPEAVSASDIRRYVEATGDRNPLWLDDAAARAAGYRSRVVPPMMVIDLSWRVKNNDTGRLWQDIPLPPVYIDTRNASTEIEWLDSVHIGDHLALRHRIDDIVAKQGRRGLGVYISKQTEYRVLGAAVVAIVRQTVVRFPSERMEKH
jgi:acyl dehydratase